jgi:hypothetical protein
VRTLLFASVFAMTVAGTTPVAALAPQSRRADADPAVTAAFLNNVHAYVQSRNRPRPQARRGDLFTPRISTYFIDVIARAFRGDEGRNIRRTIRETEAVVLPILRVNDVYPDDLPTTTMPPTLLKRLPQLPPEVIYLISGRAVILQDATTNVIVDFLPNAIPRRR